MRWLAILAWGVLLAGMSGNPAMAQTRLWTDATGKFNVKAELLDFRDGVARLRTTDGRILFVPAERLRESDQKFLQSQAATSSRTPKRTPAQIEALIKQAGSTPPDWWGSTPLDYPETLDLTWPLKPKGDWNARRNVGQYLWDVINPNPNKWREGTRVIHHLLALHQNDPQKRARAMQTLGGMYYNLHQDYARAAYWWCMAGLNNQRSPQAVKLADCYWKLGNQEMALDMLYRLPYMSSIRLLGDMGHTQRAVQAAEQAARSGYPADDAYLCAGDACRVAEQYPQAINYYQRVLQVPATGKRQGRIEQNQRRARENIAAVKLYDALDLGRIPDGVYQGMGTGYVGPIHVKVEVAGGRIKSVAVTSHKEKQFYSAVTEIPRRIKAKQGVRGIDAVTGATITSEAIVNAVAQALGGRQ